MAIGPIPVPAMPGAMEALTTQMANMSADQAYNAFMDQQYESGNDLKIGYTVRTTDKPSISGDTSNTIPVSQEPVSIDAWDDYVDGGGDVSPTTGGAVSGSKVASIALSIIERTNLSAEAVAPVAIPLDVAIVAVSQAVGVSIEAAQLNAETKQKLADSIVQSTGMVYDKAKGLVTAWKDAWGNILFPKSVLDSVASDIEEEGIGKDEPTATSALIEGLVNVGDGNAYSGTVYCRGGSASAYIAGSNALISASAEDVTFEWYYGNSGKGTSYTYDGKTVHFVALYTTPFEPYAPTQSTVSPNDIALVAWTIIYGNISQGGWPEGTSESQAQAYTPSTIPNAGSIVTDSGGRIPVVPINIPEDPYDATGSTIDPTTPTDDENAGVIYPGLPGYVPDLDDPTAEPTEENVPIPLPIPDTKPSNPSVPLVNPSVVDYTLVDELVEELANTLDPQPPQSSGIIPVPQLPGITDPVTEQRVFPSIIPDSGPGFIHVYNPTPAEFVAFGTWLWVTYADATIDKILNNPFDGVIGAHELYATPDTGGTDNIRSAFLVCPTTAALVPNRYTEIDCGTVIVPEFYGNYLDYSPYSQAYIYLPFIGINEVSIDDIVGHAVNIRYRVDSYSGACIAMIFVAKDDYQNLCYQFAGNCSVEVPMAGGSQAAIKAGMMQAEAYARAAMTQSVGNLIGGIGSALMGSIGGALSNLSGILGNYANAQAGVEAARVANKSSVQHSGQFGASHGAMGEKVPFIIIRNPVQVKVVNYNDDYGYPAHKRVIIGGCTGYLRVREVNVISAHATDTEKALIEAMLKNGVYVS